MYTKEINDVIKDLNSSLNGLTDDIVILNRHKYGNNDIKNSPKSNLLKVFIKQFDDILILILIIASIISLIMGDYQSAVVIFIVLALNSSLGTWQVLTTEASINSLRDVEVTNCIVLRNGKKVTIPSKDLVVGDIFFIENGSMINGDARLIEVNGLEVMESSLTGESIAVRKSLEKLNYCDSLGDQTNMVFKGTIAVSGKGKAICCRVGEETEIGRIANVIKETKNPETPLQKNLDHLSKILATIIFTICLIIFIFEIINKTPFINALLFSVALAVAAIPEALSSIVSITLAIGTKKLAKKNALCKNLRSVEVLGSVSVICSDKTGTLTKNEMVVNNIFHNRGKLLDLNNQTSIDLIYAMVLCSNATLTIGSETEKAIIKYLHKLDIDFENIRRNNKIKEEIPFSSETKSMEVKTNKYHFFKGAPDLLLEKIECVSLDGINYPLSAPLYYQIKAMINNFTNQGQRVLLVGQIIDLKYQFLGLIGMIDPPRNEVYQAINDCHRGNVKVVMITGDYENTAFSIANKLGIAKRKEQVISQKDIDKSDVSDYCVFARVNPLDKLKIVEKLQMKNEIVAMTGDGVNDAPALRKADIGIAMGINGTDCSKDSADIILTDDNFKTITDAIFIGRVIYNNIKNAILFLLSGNIGGLIAVVFCCIFKLPMPFTASQLLFINLVTDSLPALALGLEDYKIKDLPRNQKLVSARFLIKTGFYGSLLGVACLVAYLIGLKESASVACTMAFSTICLARLYHGVNCSNYASFFRGGYRNKYSRYSLLIGIILVNSILIFPIFKNIFAIDIINKNTVYLINLLAVIPTFIIQLFKEVEKWISLK